LLVVSIYCELDSNTKKSNSSSYIQESTEIQLDSTTMSFA